MVPCSIFFYAIYFFFAASSKCHLCTCVSDGKCIGNSEITLNFCFRLDFFLVESLKNERILKKRRDYQLNLETSFFRDRSCDLKQSWYSKSLKKDLIQLFQLKYTSIQFFYDMNCFMENLITQFLH